MRYVYVVNGEHDGFLGVYSSFKKASVAAKKYAAGRDLSFKLEEVGTSDQSDEYITFYIGKNTSDVSKELVEWHNKLINASDHLNGGHYGLITVQ